MSLTSLNFIFCCVLCFLCCDRSRRCSCHYIALNEDNRHIFRRAALRELCKMPQIRRSVLLQQSLYNPQYSYYTLRAYSAFSCLFFLMIIAVKIAAIARTIAQPTIGIQRAPKLPPVKSVPKKNTRNPIVYPTEN